MSAPANDNADRPVAPIKFSDLALALGEDEDVLLRRLAVILNKRETVAPLVAPASKP